jgi:hypothetical protein
MNIKTAPSDWTGQFSYLLLPHWEQNLSISLKGCPQFVQNLDCTVAVCGVIGFCVFVTAMLGLLMA